MTTTRSATSTAIAAAGPVFTGPEQLALAGFLAGYTGLTRQAYALDLRQYASWCQQRHIGLFQARRADIECFARDLEARGRAGPQSRGGYAPWPGSTDMPSRKSCWIIPRPLTSAGPGWIMNRTPQGWTVTSLARCWSPPGSARPVSTR